MECALSAFILLLMVFQHRIRRSYPKFGLFTGAILTAWVFWELFHSDGFAPVSFFAGIVIGIICWEQLKRLKKPRNF